MDEVETAAFRGAVYLGDGRIDCEIEHPDLGWIPITIDSEEYPVLWARATAGEVAASIPRTEDELLEEQRAEAQLTRQQFCIALKRAGILSGPDAIEAAKGAWPSTFNAALPQLETMGVDADEAQIVWASANWIERNHPLMLVMMQVAEMTDAQVDMMFGI